VRERQEADGSWGGIQPPWVWSLIMLAALGHGFEDETFARGLAGWERFMVRDGDRRGRDGEIRDEHDVGRCVVDPPEGIAVERVTAGQRCGRQMTFILLCQCDHGLYGVHNRLHGHAVKTLSLFRSRVFRRAAIGIVVAHDVILAQIGARLHFDQPKRLFARVFQTMLGAKRNEGRLVFVQQKNLLIAGYLCRALHHDPMLGTLFVALQR